MPARGKKSCFNLCIIYVRFVGNLLKGQTVGVIGAGRIGSAYARMMVNFASHMSHTLPQKLRHILTYLIQNLKSI